jgi:uncharacterized protein YecT (DUF1311 family)
MKTLLKIFVVLVFGVQLVNAMGIDLVTKYQPTECSLAVYTGEEAECIELIYQDINERLGKVYRQLVSTLPKDNKTKFIKEYQAWSQKKDKQCEQYSYNKIILKSCRIDAAIPKLNELWKLDNEINVNQFEGKWLDCSDKYNGGVACLVYFLVQQDNNICGTWHEINNIRWYTEHFSGRALYIAQENNNATSVRVCDDIDDVYCDDHRVDTDFSDWEKYDRFEILAEQRFIEKPFNVKMRTPIFRDEKERLIRENKWLQDCLNYKGEQ